MNAYFIAREIIRAIFLLNCKIRAKLTKSSGCIKIKNSKLIIALQRKVVEKWETMEPTPWLAWLAV